MTKKIQFSIGADPELFAIDKRGQIQSCIGLLGGDKHHPRMVGNYGIQEDNVMAEFNIPPAMSKDEFITNVMGGINTVQELLAPHGLEVSQYTTARFKRTQLTDKKCFVFGCDPDFGMTDLQPLPTPTIPKFVRYAGGHVHIGCDITEGLIANNNSFTLMALNAYVGLFCTYMDRDTERKKKYGTPYRHRPKWYGLEYRLPSNFWIFKPSTIGAMYDMVERALHVAAGRHPNYTKEERKIWDKIMPYSGQRTITKVIEENDKDTAITLLSEYCGMDMKAYCDAL